MFLDPSEAVFVLLGEYEELEPHTDLRQELLRRRLAAAINDPRPMIPAEQVFAELRQELAAPRPEPAAWMPPSARAVPNGLVHSADQGLE